MVLNCFFTNLIAIGIHNSSKNENINPNKLIQLAMLL